MEAKELLSRDHRARSDFVRKLVERSCDHCASPAAFSTALPKTIVQFWDDLNSLPQDVKECMESWRILEEQGFELLVYDYTKARDFIAGRLGLRYKDAYAKCYHPAMQSDYFRLCYIYAEGGCYVDADDVYRGSELTHLFHDGRLKIQPLCYNIFTDQMVSLANLPELEDEQSYLIFYFNNNPLAAIHGHPIVERALANATEVLEQYPDGDLPEIQSTTGPGILTKSLFEIAAEDREIVRSLLLLRDWEEAAVSKWPLSYRQDARNWRISNQRDYTRANEEGEG